MTTSASSASGESASLTRATTSAPASRARPGRGEDVGTAAGLGNRQEQRPGELAPRRRIERGHRRRIGSDRRQRAGLDQVFRIGRGMVGTAARASQHERRIERTQPLSEQPQRRLQLCQLAFGHRGGFGGFRVEESALDAHAGKLSPLAAGLSRCAPRRRSLALVVALQALAQAHSRRSPAGRPTNWRRTCSRGSPRGRSGRRCSRRRGPPNCGRRLPPRPR